MSFLDQLKKAKADANPNPVEVPIDESKIEVIPEGTKGVYIGQGIVRTVSESANPESPVPQASQTKGLLRFKLGGSAPAKQATVSINERESSPEDGRDLSRVPQQEPRADSNLPTAPNGIPEAITGENAGPANFQARLKALDSLCQDAAGINPLVYDKVKAHVKDIMIDLQTNPEMQGLLIDRDVHNVMLFVQASTQRADLKVTKTAATRDKRVKNSQVMASMEDAFDQILLGAPAATLEGIANLNTDSLAVKER